jgi:hypothetical protein
MSTINAMIIIVPNAFSDVTAMLRHQFNLRAARSKNDRSVWTSGKGMAQPSVS